MGSSSRDNVPDKNHRVPAMAASDTLDDADIALSPSSPVGLTRVRVSTTPTLNVNVNVNANANAKERERERSGSPSAIMEEGVGPAMTAIPKEREESRGNADCPNASIEEKTKTKIKTKTKTKTMTMTMTMTKKEKVSEIGGRHTSPIEKPGYMQSTHSTKAKARAGEQGGVVAPSPVKQETPPKRRPDIVPSHRFVSHMRTGSSRALGLKP